MSWSLRWCVECRLRKTKGDKNESYLITGHIVLLFFPPLSCSILVTYRTVQLNGDKLGRNDDLEENSSLYKWISPFMGEPILGSKRDFKWIFNKFLFKYQQCCIEFVIFRFKLAQMKMLGFFYRVLVPVVVGPSITSTCNVQCRL